MGKNTIVTTLEPRNSASNGFFEVDVDVEYDADAGLELVNWTVEEFVLAYMTTGIALARLRSALSAALHMAYSGRVMTHMAESRGGGHMEEDVGEDPEMPFGGGGV
ncbi:hypothetical protein JKP88DRAFT_277986 [Tribonema minus]|uniref:Uncharacterized protein n=1 Tax=Tribonema minus TaxID=303371 RepID=A0A835Z047_9STRA|nr:hypothetical protein JKP88DRAFT_277986 [Tribonema minus]